MTNVQPATGDDQTVGPELVRCDNCGRHGWHETDRCPSDLREYHAGHVTWCTNRDTEFTEHTDDEPYCSKLISSVPLQPEGEIRKGQVWISPTHAFTQGQFTPAEYSAREELYDGVELTIELWRGPKNGWADEHKLRLNSGAARSLAAALVRAADIEEGLTR